MLYVYTYIHMYVPTSSLGYLYCSIQIGPNKIVNAIVRRQHLLLKSKYHDVV